jgi:homoserine kinase
VIHVIDSVLLPPAPQANENAARQIIREAVSHGAPMYNRGHHSACAAIYQVAAMSLMKLSGDEMPEAARADLQRAMEKADHSHCSATRAWALRHGLDAVYMAMTEVE